MAYRVEHCVGLAEAKDELSRQAIKDALYRAETPEEIAALYKEIWIAVLDKRVKL